MFNSLTNEEISLYERHFAIEDFTFEHQLKLKTAKVLIVGVGGLGSPISIYLTAAGIGTIGIIDNDIVSISNLQRQILYNHTEIGLNKTDIAESKLKLINPNLNIIKFNERLTNDNAEQIISQFDIVVDGTDNFITRYLIDDVSNKYKIPYVYGSIKEFTGQVSVFNFKDGISYKDLYPCEETNRDNSVIGVMGFIPAITGSLQVAEVIKIITGLGVVLSRKLLIFDSLKNQYKVLNI